MSRCLAPMPVRAIANVKPDVRRLAYGARCHKPYGHAERHEATIQVPHGLKLVPLNLRWKK